MHDAVSQAAVLRCACVVCGVEFSYKRQGNGRRRCFCSPECKMKKARSNGRKYRTEGRYKGRRYPCQDRPRRKHIAKTCVVCGADFRTSLHQTATCGRACGWELSRRAAVKWHGESPNSPKKFATRADRDRHYSYRRRAIVAGSQAEHFASAAIFDRDGWVCQICHQPVDPALKWPSPASASLDHITPISRGGHHTKANCQLAHLGCNSRKGNGTGIKNDEDEGEARAKAA